MKHIAGGGPEVGMYIGIDPGIKGGIAFTIEDKLFAEPMPATETDIFWLLDELSETAEKKYALIEIAGARPRQKGAAKFAAHYGFLRGVLVALRIPFGEVAPGKWQKAMRCLTKGDKNISKARAQQLHPELKITHSTADAILICEYARQVVEK